MFTLYQCLTWAVLPLLPFWQWIRCRMGKEDEARWRERYGISAMARPAGRVLWFHAASVGESMSVLPLIERILAAHPDASIVVTTCTVTSAKAMAGRLPPRAFHQYVPYDSLFGVNRFLDHWRPCLAFWTESEFWPNLLRQARLRCPIVLLNARLSARSAEGWQRFPAVIARLLSCFSLILAKGEEDAERLRRLGALHVVVKGNLKLSAKPLEADPAHLEDFRRFLSGRVCWIAASTHPGEERMIAEVHRQVAKDHLTLLTIIVPRHALRGDSIAVELRSAGLTLAQRSKREMIHPDTQIYLADTMGELGLFYRLAGIAFIGGSLVPHGGQNPLEAARLDCAILYGPHMHNFADFCSTLESAQGALPVNDVNALAFQLSALLRDPANRDALAAHAATVTGDGENVLDQVYAEIEVFVETALRPNASPSIMSEA